MILETLETLKIPNLNSYYTRLKGKCVGATYCVDFVLLNSYFSLKGCVKRETICGNRKTSSRYMHC